VTRCDTCHVCHTCDILYVTHDTIILSCVIGHQMCHGRTFSSKFQLSRGTVKKRFQGFRRTSKKSHTMYKTNNRLSSSTMKLTNVNEGNHNTNIKIYYLFRRSPFRRKYNFHAQHSRKWFVNCLCTLYFFFRMYPLILSYKDFNKLKLFFECGIPRP
jgi:hypothetical protein